MQYYDALIDFIGHYLKRDRHKYKKWGWKKNGMNLDIRAGSEYYSDEWNKLFSFSKKSYIKSYYLRYSHVLYKITTLEKSERFDALPHDFL